MANPEQTEITSVGAWKKDKGEVIVLPSGNRCRLNRPGIEKLFTAGVLPDELTKIAIDNIAKAQAPGKPQDHLPKGGVNPDALDPQMLKNFLEKDGAVQEIFASFDRVVEMCVIDPPVRYHMEKVVSDSGHVVTDAETGKVQWREIPASERDPDVLYTDDVDQDDKTFIFNYVVGGTRDLEQFRAQFGDALADVQPRQDVELPPV